MSKSLKPDLKIVHQDVPGNTATSCCPNCRAQTQDNFCSRCGEATTVHSPSAGEFLHEFIGHYVALEGKSWGTLRLLMFRPGRLTADYLRGKRIPYINPLRLYLTLSLVMFALMRLYGVDLPQVTLDDKSLGASYIHSVPDPANPKRIGTVNIAIKATQGDEPGDLTVSEALTWLGSVDATWTKNVKRFISTSPAEKADLVNHGLLGNLPYMLIGALPLFALYLKLMYLRTERHYGEHLVFALHVSAFVFFLVGVMIVMPGNLGWLFVCIHERMFTAISSWDWLQLLPVAWTLGYLPTAMRRVYGGSWPGICAKSLVLMTVHLAVIFSLVVCAEIITILKHG
jgi:hypothetical protein